MDFMVKCSIVLLTVTVVGAVLSSSSDSGQDNREMKAADGLPLEDRSESRQDHARGEPERNELIAKRQNIDYILSVKMTEDSEPGQVKVRLSGCSGQRTGFVEFIPNGQSTWKLYSTRLVARDIGDEVKFIEIERDSRAEWLPLQFEIEHGNGMSIKHECNWGSLCTFCQASPHDCPFRVGGGITAIPCRRVQE